MRRSLSALALLLCGVAWLTVRPAPPAIVAEAAPQAPQGTRAAWAVDVLGRLGNAAPSAATVAFLVQWSRAEDASDGAFARHNPLNTTQTSGAVVSTINDDGVRGYASYEDGMAATLQTLSYGYYTEIVAGLLSNDPERAKRGLFNSPWASSHYGYGASWPKE